MNKQEVKRNKRLEGIFDRASAAYESAGPGYFSYFGKSLVQKMGIRDGSSVLDVACGKGASLIPAACAAGKGGQVTGVDFSLGMVNQLKAIINDQRMNNAAVFQMDAEQLDFPDESFDFVLCGLSTAFFSDSIKAINEMHRVLKAGGRFGLSTWKKRDKQGILDTAYSRTFPNNPHTNLNTLPGRPDFSTREGIETILSNAGFKNIDILFEEKKFYYKDENEWWQEQWSNASRGLFEFIESMGGDSLERFREAAYEEIASYREKEGIAFEAGVILSFGSK